MILLSSSIEGLMRLREEQLSSPFSISRDPDSVDDGSPISKWEWISDPLDCPPNERCKPESMVGTMNPLDGNPRPFQGGEQVRPDYAVYSSFLEKSFTEEEKLNYLIT
ncbi:hypothetical protein J5U22_01400 [Saccharolobus shibatae]|uniref:Uncharacterized protein n=2 Tax=Saccharolobus shibatae TaxID=2286 RepID=A0A8F5C0T0_9CREN|nr:hypothetical protein J5U22_01400 [Saccharolobus shibatae]